MQPCLQDTRVSAGRTEDREQTNVGREERATRPRKGNFARLAMPLPIQEQNDFTGLDSLAVVHNDDMMPPLLRQGKPLENVLRIPHIGAHLNLSIGGHGNFQEGFPIQ